MYTISQKQMAKLFTYEHFQFFRNNIQILTIHKKKNKTIHQ